MEHALLTGGADKVLKAHRRRPYLHELLFSTVVALTTPVLLGLYPSLRTVANADAATDMLVWRDQPHRV